ncbi:MAG: hypothetical protein ACK4GN_07480 [Runella sp.]
MTIGFVVSFFDFRNDVRRVIAEVAKQHKVVILGQAQNRDQILRHLPQGVEFRLINEKKITFWNSLWTKLYLLLKKIPKSENNFYLMELYKASLVADPTARRRSYALLKWIHRLPKIISYDFYLNRLTFQKETNLGGIDQFVCFTAIADDFLMARLLRENQPVKVYVYSWDHACKHTCFSKKVKYIAWNEAIKEDIAELQHIEPSQIKVIGASQFGYIEEYRKKAALLEPTYSFEYIYFGCAIGATDLVPDEVEVVKTLAGILAQTRPDLRLVVRPYPVQGNWQLYDSLREIPNIVMDDGFRTLDLSVKDDHILEKLEKITHAKAFFHLGTTMGLEACFTDTPSFIVDFGYQTTEGLSLYNFIHQYQNDRHLIALAPQNAVRSPEHLKEILHDLENVQYLHLNEKVRNQYTMLSFGEFAQLLTEI